MNFHIRLGVFFFSFSTHGLRFNYYMRTECFFLIKHADNTANPYKGESINTSKLYYRLPCINADGFLSCSSDVNLSFFTQTLLWFHLKKRNDSKEYNWLLEEPGDTLRTGKILYFPCKWEWSHTWKCRESEYWGFLYLLSRERERTEYSVIREARAWALNKVQ